MKRALLILLITPGLWLPAQTEVTTGRLLTPEIASSLSSIDTLLPVLATDSCSAASTYYLLNNQIISGAAVLNNGFGISKVAQLFDSENDSIRIGSVTAELVYVDLDSGFGEIRAGIYAEQDLQTPLAQSLPVPASLLTDTSGPTIVNDFYFANPVRVKGKFWVMLNVFDRGDSVFLATTGDDCGGGSAIYYDGQQWRKYKDQFMVNQDPLDIALKMSVVMERIVANAESALSSIPSKIFPNPASAYTEIHLPREHASAKVSFYSSVGKQVFSDNDYESARPIMTGNFPAGLYLVVIEQGSWQSSVKILIQP